MRVATLRPPSLNFWAAKAAGMPATVDRPPAAAVRVRDPDSGDIVSFEPSTDWSHALPMLSDAWYEIETILIDWFGEQWARSSEVRDNPLAWFMRAFVAVKFGDEVEGWPTGDDE